MDLKNGPSFFKVLFGDDFTHKLRVPPAFVNNFNGCKLPTRVTLNSDEGSISWRVKMEMNDRGCYITVGWDRIVRGLKLEQADFLVFKLVSQDLLEVTAFAPTGCQKKMSCSNSASGARKSYTGQVEMKLEDDEEEEIIGNDQKIRDKVKGKRKANASGHLGKSKELLCFTKCLSYYEMRCINLPAAFAKAAPLWHKKKALIRSPQGRHWSVKLITRSNQGRLRADLSTGWSVFIKDNALAPGDTIQFKYLGGKDNVIAVDVLNRVF